MLEESFTKLKILLDEFEKRTILYTEIEGRNGLIVMSL